MYIIFASIVIMIIILFGSGIVSMIKSNVSNSTPNVKMGNMWFAILLIINISVVIFIYVFYYYKTSKIGKIGPTGDKGFEGVKGETCMIPNCDYYATYNKM
jgi:heme/copper-type cytochrome/quinol oxidase subunit 2